VYTIDAQKRRDALGYVMLDLRGASATVSGGEKWMHLVNSKISGPYKPELKVSFSVVTKGQDSVTQEVPKEQVVSTIVKTMDSPSSPVKGGPTIKFNENAGYYQIGNGTETWCLWLTIAFAENLGIIKDKQSLSHSSYYFYYSFLGNDITTQKFSQLSSPDFPAERVSIKLVGSESDIGLFLKDSGKLFVYLCQETKALGFAQVNLYDLLSQVGPLKVVENVFPLMDHEQGIIQSDDGTRPVIGVSLALKRPDIDIKNTGLNSEKVIAPQEKNDGQFPLKNIPVGSYGSDQQSLPNSLKENFKNLIETETSSSSVPWHQFRFSIDIRTIRDFKLKFANIFFKFSYVPFGTSSPCITHPTVAITNQEHDKSLPPSFFAFEFVMPLERLATYMDAVPLVIEMWIKDENAKDAPLGICTVNLAPVLMENAKLVEYEKTIKVKSLDAFYLVTASGHDDEVSKKVADLRVVLALEDFGPIEEEFVEPQSETKNQGVEINPPKQQHLRKEPVFHQAKATAIQDQVLNVSTQQPKMDQMAYNSVQKPQPINTNSMKESHEKSDDISAGKNAIYLVDQELESFRLQEERKFRERLQKREGELLSQLVTEWKKREKERDFVLKKKLDELNGLESQFQKLILDLENRERKLDQGEEDLIKRRQDLEREFDRRIEEARDATRRLQEEFKHKIEIEKRKTTDVESQKARVVQEREEWETRFRDLDRDFTEYKRGLGATSEAQLRAELNVAVQAKAELESRVNTLTQSKKHYKSEWIKAVANLSKLKKDYQAEQESAQNREKREFQRLKAQLLAKEEMGILDADRLAIRSLTKDLDILKNRTDNAQSVPHVLGDNLKKENLDPAKMREIDRLTKERDSLLNSGAYSLEDRLIRELNIRITNMLS
jgi:centrosomal protein CEP120